VGYWHGYLSGARCRLAYGQLMPLPLTVSCFSKIQISFTFLALAHPGSPGKWPLNGCVCYPHNGGDVTVNSLLIDLPPTHIQRLQSVQNAAAKLIFNLRRCDYINDALISLHWLRVPERIICKVATLTYRALHGSAPTYFFAGLSSRVVSASDCGVRGSRFESRR